MAWGTGWPPINSTTPALATDVDLYDWLIKIWKACRERGWASGAEFFPRTTIVHDIEPYPTSYAAAPGYTGKIDFFTANGDTYTLIDSSKAWSPNPNRWFGFDNSATPWLPQYYDVVIENDEFEPWGVVRSPIQGSTGTSLTVDALAIDNAVTAGQIPSAAGLVGKRYCI